MLKHAWLWLVCLWSDLVFAAKHRAGFLDLGKDLDITGTVVHDDGGVGGDGDWCFELRPDPRYQWTVEFAARTTAASGQYSGCLECEVMPRERPMLESRLKELRRRLLAGETPHVRVRGRWGFDGVHDGGPLWWMVIKALAGHGPDVAGGWCEIHPVSGLELL